MENISETEPLVDSTELKISLSPSCSSCHLPIVTSGQKVCPECGSTSPAWKQSGIFFLSFLIIFGYTLGEVIGEFLIPFLSPLHMRAVMLILSGLFFLMSVTQPVRRNSGEDFLKPVLVRCAFSSFPVFAGMLHPSLLSPWFWPVFSIVALFHVVDAYFYSFRKGPSSRFVLHTISKRMSHLAQKRTRVMHETERIGQRKKTDVTGKIQGQLVDVQKVLENELAILNHDRQFTSCLIRFHRWKNTLCFVVRHLPKFTILELDMIEAHLEILRQEALDMKKDLEIRHVSQHKRAGRISALISTIYPVHEKIPDLISQMRVKTILSGVDLIKNYDLPELETPIFVEGLDLTSELLDDVNSRYHKISLDQRTNEILRED